MMSVPVELQARPRKPSLIGQTRSDLNTLLSNSLDRLEELSNKASHTSVDPQLLQDEKIQILGQLARVFKAQQPLDNIKARRLFDILLQNLADPSTTLIRAHTYRIYRHYAPSLRDKPLLFETGLDVFMCRSMAQDPSLLQEKEQALLLLRTAMQAKVRPSLLPIRLVRALIAMAESIDDPLRGIAAETLLELTVLDLPLVFQAGGIRLLTQMLNDGTENLSQPILQTLLHLCQTPQGRKFISPQIIVNSALCAINDLYDAPNKQARLQQSIACAHTLLTSWVGLTTLASSGDSALRTLLMSMHSPDDEIAQAVIETLQSLFVSTDIASVTPRTRPRHNTGLSLISNKTSLNGGTEESMITNSGGLQSDPLHIQPLLLNLMLQNGIWEALGEAMLSSSDAIAQNARILAETLTTLVAHTIPFDETMQAVQNQSWISNALSTRQIHNAQVHMTLCLLQDHVHTSLPIDPDSFKRKTSVRSRANSLLHSRALDETSLDDAQFRTALLETQVLITREPRSWDLNTVIGLLDGPLCQPKRLDEAFRGSKFLKRLISFFYLSDDRQASISSGWEPPPKDRFCFMQPGPANEPWLAMGQSLITCLLQTAEGQRILAEDFLFAQINSLLQELSTVSPSKDGESIYEWGYFHLIALLERSEVGRMLMARHGLITGIYNLLETNPLWANSILNKMDLLSGHGKLFLAVILATEDDSPRRKAVESFLLPLITEGAPSWVVRVALDCLFDIDPHIQTITMDRLCNVCRSKTMIQKLVELKINIVALGDRFQQLATDFLALSTGFDYLNREGYISRELDYWFSEGNVNWVLQSSPSSKISFLKQSHFFGLIAQTQGGANLIKERGYISQFATVLRTASAESVVLISLIMALGHIGSSEAGFGLILGLVSDILKFCATHDLLTVRHAAYCALSLICRSLVGAEYLQQAGWHVSYLPDGQPAGICLPSNDILTLTDWTWCDIDPDACEVTSQESLHPTHEAVLANIIRLTNQINATVAAKALSQLRQTSPKTFEHPTLIHAIHKRLDKLHFRQPARKFIYNLIGSQMSVDTALNLSRN